jgi:hypothetical protein
LPGLLELPNELLFDIASCLSFPDLRRLSRVSRRLQFIVGEYLPRYRYKSRLLTLPNNILLRVARLLDTRKDQSRFARTSQRFYPLVMGHIVRHNIQYEGSSLMNYASERNVKGMAQGILYLGGNVESLQGSSIIVYGGATPLTTAAYYGHERMVRFLINVGASQLLDGYRGPLAVAIARGRENVALILSQELEGNDTLRRGGPTVLQRACEALLVNLVHSLLERETKSPHEQSIRNRSIALYHLLDMNACRNEFARRELLEYVYQIAMMLLRHGADPDMCVKQTHRGSETARHAGLRHPESRMRNLLSRATVMPQTGPEEYISRIGPSVMIPWATSTSDELQSRELFLGKHPHGTPSGFLGGTYPSVRTSFGEKRSNSSMPNGYAEDYTLNSSDMHAFTRARRPAELDHMGRPTMEENFPRLGTTTRAVDETGRDIWTRFSQHENLRASSETNQVVLCDEGKERQGPGNKNSKKKQWVPLLIGGSVWRDD